MSEPQADTAMTPTAAPPIDEQDQPTELAAPAEPIPEAGPIVTTSVVPIALEQGVLVIADSATVDEKHCKSPHSHNVQSGWAIDVQGASARDLALRVAATWKKEELVDGTWRITVSNDNEARNLRDKMQDLMATNPDMANA